MNGLVKKYLPYGVVILLIYMLVPIIFISKSLQGFSTVAYYFIFPATAIVCCCNVLFKVRNGLFVYTYSSCRIHSEYAYL